jgi:hypothetical protein
MQTIHWMTPHFAFRLELVFWLGFFPFFWKYQSLADHDNNRSLNRLYALYAKLDNYYIAKVAESSKSDDLAYYPCGLWYVSCELT